MSLQEKMGEWKEAELDCVEAMALSGMGDFTRRLRTGELSPFSYDPEARAATDLAVIELRTVTDIMAERLRRHLATLPAQQPLV